MSEKKTKKPRQRLGAVLKHNAVMVAKIARLTPEYIVLVVLEGVILGALQSMMALFNYRLFNDIDLGKPFRDMAVTIGVMAVAYLLFYLFHHWYWSVCHPLVVKKLDVKLQTELLVKAGELDLACYDDPSFYNDFVWAMKDATGRATQVLEDLGKIVNRFVASGTLFTLLFRIDVFMAAVLFICAVLSIVVSRIGNRLTFEKSKEEQPLERKGAYLIRMYQLADHAKEIRLSHVDDLLMKEYDENNKKFLEMNVRYGKKYFLIYGICSILLNQVTSFGVILYMFLQLSRGNILLGGFTASIGVMWQVRWQLRDLVNRFMQFPKHSLYIEKYLSFLSYEPKVKSGALDVPPFETLELKNVSFSYERLQPSSDEGEEEAYRALSDVSLTLRRGEKIAIVGYNGAGKTTLIKLLMRFYDPVEGQVLYNGIDVRELKTEPFRDKIGAVFQDYRLFAATVAENVMNGAYCPERDEETVRRALEASDFSTKLNTLEKGVDTPLSREFDDEGTNLSGGEAQKVAIARVFARPYEIVIMDEPSSALDPMAEYELNRSILRYTEDKTVVFISHRLSTTRIADRIYMFDGGRLIESGSHDELMVMGGKYAEMFELQASKYREES